MELNGVNFDTYFRNYPDKDGFFGKYGGVYVDDKLKAAMAEITIAYYSICQSRKFIAELRRIRAKLDRHAHAGNGKRDASKQDSHHNPDEY